MRTGTASIKHANKPQRLVEAYQNEIVGEIILAAEHTNTGTIRVGDVGISVDLDRPVGVLLDAKAIKLTGQMQLTDVYIVGTVVDDLVSWVSN